MVEMLSLMPPERQAACWLGADGKSYELTESEGNSRAETRRRREGNN